MLSRRPVASAPARARPWLARGGAGAIVATVCIAVVLSISGRAFASEPSAASAAEAEAYARFERGNALMREGSLEAALAEFLASRAIVATRGNTQNAAICLKRLGRFDEALDLLEALLRDTPRLTPEDRRKLAFVADDLRRAVGVLEIDSLEPGATVLVDGRVRGRTPLSNPIRVPSGSHVVRIVGEGIEPYEARVDVAGQQRVALTPRLVATKTVGRLSVVEIAGLPATVVVDNAPVGRAPWSGIVAPGRHSVVLRGEGNLGTQPVRVTLREGELTPVRLAMEPLDASVRVVPSPAAARVALDGVELGRGIWQGEVRVGEHVVEAAEDGFLPARSTVSLARGEHGTLALTLERDPSSALWHPRRPPRVVLTLRGALAVARSLGGDVGACGSTCDAGVPLGERVAASVAYELASGLGFGLSLGYDVLGQSISNRSAALYPRGRDPVEAATRDDLTFSAASIGAVVSLRTHGTLWVQTSFAVGPFFGRIYDRREGRVVDTTSREVTVGPLAQEQAVFGACLSPSVAVARQLGDRFALGVDLSGSLYAFAARPRWSMQIDLAPAGSLGLARYRDESITGKTVLSFGPSIFARAAF